ncbi:unnamed protein product [Allacma fusca]|uniref:Ionotropic glutamate receptor C-terminal domain-containing protein n=1 Tax=Allacma fusca TaxID=39272 RepID=A0A8J2PJ11_9HEXA|nr:unnamed protein product [Allacma fusca]
MNPLFVVPGLKTAVFTNLIALIVYTPFRIVSSSSKSTSKNVIDCVSTTIIFPNLDLLENLMLCSQMLGIHFETTEETLKEFNSIKLHSINYIQKLNQNLNYKLSYDYLRYSPRYRSNCQTVIVLMETSLNILSRFETTLSEHANVILSPKYDFFKFLHLKSRHDTENTVNLYIPANWISKLRHKKFYQADSMCEVIAILQEDSEPSTVREYLKGKELEVTALEVDSNVIVKDGAPVEGMFFKLLHSSSQYYNFTYNLEVPVFKGTTQLPNGTWTGPFGDVISGKKDLVLGGGHTHERHRYFEFPTFVELAGLRFTISPPKSNIDWTAMFYVFQPRIWFCLSASTLLTILTVALSTHLHEYSYDMSTSMLLIIGSLLEQSTKTPKISTVRFTVGIWTLMAVVIITYYKSNFIAYITYPAGEGIPRTFEELSARSDYKLQLMNANASGRAFFMQTTNPIYVRIRDRLIIENNWIRCMTASAFEEKTTCINQDFIGYGVIAKNLTLSRVHASVEFSQDNAFNFNWNMQFTKNSKYVESFNVILRCLRDTGHLRKWVQDSYEYRRRESIRWLQSIKDKSKVYEDISKSLLQKESSNNFKPFNLKNVLITFIIWGLGSSLALSTFLLENLLAIIRGWRSRVLSNLHGIFYR